MSLTSKEKSTVITALSATALIASLIKPTLNKLNDVKDRMYNKSIEAANILSAVEEVKEVTVERIQTLEAEYGKSEQESIVNDCNIEKQCLERYDHRSKMIDCLKNKNPHKIIFSTIILPEIIPNLQAHQEFSSCQREFILIEAWCLKQDIECLQVSASNIYEQSIEINSTDVPPNLRDDFEKSLQMEEPQK